MCVRLLCCPAALLKPTAQRPTALQVGAERTTSSALPVLREDSQPMLRGHLRKPSSGSIGQLVNFNTMEESGEVES